MRNISCTAGTIDKARTNLLFQMLTIDQETGLQYRQEYTSADFTGVSLKASDPCLPDEVANKRSVDNLEAKFTVALSAIHSGVTMEDIASLLQPLKDGLDALKHITDSTVVDRLDRLDKLVNDLVKAGVGTGTIIQQGAVFRYFNLGLQQISYSDVILCGRKIVTTTVVIDPKTDCDLTPVALRRLAKGKYAESLSMPNIQMIDGMINVYFQGVEQVAVGDFQLLVAIEENPASLGNVPMCAEIIAKAGIEPASDISVEVMPVAETPDSEVPTEAPGVETANIELPNGTVKLNAYGAVIWHINDTEEFTSGVQMTEIFLGQDKLYGSNGKNYSVTSTDNPSWSKIDKSAYESAKQSAKAIIVPPSRIAST